MGLHKAQAPRSCPQAARPAPSNRLPLDGYTPCRHLTFGAVGQLLDGYRGGVARLDLVLVQQHLGQRQVRVRGEWGPLREGHVTLRLESLPMCSRFHAFHAFTT